MRADLHVDTLWRLEEKGGALTPTRDDLQIDSTRCQEGEVNLLCTAVFTEDKRVDPWEHCGRLLDVKEMLSSDPHEPFVSVTQPSQLERLEAGVTGMLATIENARCLEGDLSRLEILHRRGVRILGVTWNGTNELGQGVMDDQHGGLTDFGNAAVLQAAKLGWAIDVSHLNREGVLDVCESGAPVIATHSNCRSLHEHPRNLTDELLELLARSGGFVGINVFPPFLAPADTAVTLETVADHILYALEIVGVNRVGLGTDLDGISRTPEGFRDHRDLQRLESTLVNRGLDPVCAKGVLGDNFVNWWKSWSGE